MRPDGRIGNAKFFCHHVTLKEAALVPAILFWPGHTNPSLSADAFAEGAVVRIAMPGTVRIKSAFGDFVGEKCAHLLPQSIAFGRQANLIELQFPAHRDATIGQNSSAPHLATCLPSSTAQKHSLPKSSRQASVRSVKRCKTCSLVNPMAPNTCWAMPAPSVAASAQRIFAEAPSRNAA